MEDKRPSDVETKAESSLPASTVAQKSEDKSAQGEVEPTQDTISQRPTTASGWLGGWLSRPAPQSQDVVESGPQPLEASDTPTVDQQAPSSETLGPQMTENSKTASNTTSAWFGLWSTSASTAGTETHETQIPVKVAKDEDKDIEEAQKAANPPASGSSWAFWSTEKSKRPANNDEATQESGELAVSGEASQNKPEPAKIATVEEGKKGKSSKRERPQSLEVEEAPKDSPQLKPAKELTRQSATPSKPSPPNLLIPSVRQTYRLVENPSILQQIGRLLLHGHQPPAKHVCLTKDAPKIKKALAVG